jgi:glutamate 5-kinase
MTTKMSRNAISDAKRIVVKVGSSSLTSINGGLDVQRLVDLVDGIATRSDAEIVLVSSGAIAAGLSPLGLTKRPKDLSTQQAAASVGQGRLMAEYSAAFAKHNKNVGQVLLTVEDITRRTNYNNAQKTLVRLLELGVMPIVNENDTVATNEIRFGDNDRLAALVAILVQADALILLSDVEGLFAGHPDSGAPMVAEVKTANELSDLDIGGVGSAIGSGGMVTKVEAAKIASAAGISVVLTSAKNTSTALTGKEVGTYFVAAANRKPSRTLWLEHASATRGELIVDSGAANALINRGSSLLSAGVVEVRGEFEAGDAVDIQDKDGRTIGRGLVAFESSDIPKLIGKSTQEIIEKFGVEFEKELIHRDDLVILKG